MKINEYRAWHKDEKRMYYTDESMKFPSGKRSWWVWQASFLIKMQYILIRDKHGMKIYEGDIAKFRDFEEERREHIGVVQYDEDNARFTVYDGSQIKVQNPWLDENLEVLGNFLQNPELLPECLKNSLFDGSQS